MTILIGVVDDHQSFLTSMRLLIDSFTNMRVVLLANNGQDLLDKMLAAPVQPDICLIDVNMPVMDGPATAARMATIYPSVKTLAMSMEEQDERLINMLRSGCRGWWPKHFSPEELERGILEVRETGYYNADPLHIAYRRGPAYSTGANVDLSVDEKKLLGYCCSDLTEEGIRDMMGMSENRLYERYQTLFERLHVRSRVGAALEGIRRGIHL